MGSVDPWSYVNGPLNWKTSCSIPPTCHVCICRYTREAGVRALERKFGAICRAVAVKVAEGHRGTEEEDLKPGKGMRQGGRRLTLGSSAFPLQVYTYRNNDRFDFSCKIKLGTRWSIFRKWVVNKGRSSSVIGASCSLESLWVQPPGEIILLFWCMDSSRVFQSAIVKNRNKTTNSPAWCHCLACQLLT